MFSLHWIELAERRGVNSASSCRERTIIAPTTAAARGSRAPAVRPHAVYSAASKFSRAHRCSCQKQATMSQKSMSHEARGRDRERVGMQGGVAGFDGDLRVYRMPSASMSARLRPSGSACAPSTADPGVAWARQWNAEPVYWMIRRRARRAVMSIRISQPGRIMSSSVCLGC